MTDRPTPYKSVGRRTVVGLCEHKTLMSLKDREIAELKAQVKELEITKSALASAEHGIKYWSTKAERAERIIDKLTGFVE